MRCEARTTVVRAIVYDGDTVDADDVTAWVRQTSLDPFVTVTRTAEGQLVVREHADGSTRESLIRRGDLGIQAPTSGFGWDTITAERFHHGFTVMPRECPVYETNDTVE